MATARIKRGVSGPIEQGSAAFGLITKFVLQGLRAIVEVRRAWVQMNKQTGISVGRGTTGGAGAEHHVPGRGLERLGAEGTGPVKARENEDGCAPTGKDRPAIFKQLLLAVIFVALFLLTDGSSTASQAWEGAPPCYLPVGLALALMLCGGKAILPIGVYRQPDGGDGELSPADRVVVRITGSDPAVFRLRGRSDSAARAMAN